MWCRIAAVPVLALLLASCGDDAVLTTGGPAASVVGSAWARVPDAEGVFGGPGEDGFLLEDVTAGGPGVVAVGTDDPGAEGSAVVWVSADGYTWTRIPDDEAVFGGSSHPDMSSVTAGGPGVVAVGAGWLEGQGDAIVWVSADGYAWTRIPHDEAVFGGSADQRMASVTAGGPGLVAVGTDGAFGETDGAVWVSVDGYAWTRLDDEGLGGPDDQLIQSVAAGGPGFIAVGVDYSRGDGDAAVWVSADGYSWARLPGDESLFGGPGDQVMSSVTAGGPGLIALGVDYTGEDLEGAVWVSPPPG